MKRKVRTKAKLARAKRTGKVTRKKRKTAQAPQANPLEAVVTANAASLGIPLETAWRESVTFNLGLIMRHAALVDEFALSDEAEPAPVYRA
jgi:1-carboxybiuret hydrolase subunit AtzG-like protein